MNEPVDLVKTLETQAARHRTLAEQAECDWIWEVRVRAAEQLERRAKELRACLMCSPHCSPSRPHRLASRVGRAPAVGPDVWDCHVGGGDDRHRANGRSTPAVSGQLGVAHLPEGGSLGLVVRSANQL
jgi:hypothetical protein